MAKTPGTPDQVGLIHMPNIKPLWPVEYQQVGGFGPINRDMAFRAIKEAGNIGHIKPDTVWIQRGEVIDSNLEYAIRQARMQFRVVEEIVRDGNKANEGWGVYYQYGKTVIVEHTSDPNSFVIRKGGTKVLLPHLHVELASGDKVAATGRGTTFKVERVDRMGTPSPLTSDKAKLNHHLYYIPFS